MTKVTLLHASVTAILVARGKMTNIERIERPLGEDHAAALLLDATVMRDTRILAAHRLLDIAIEKKDAGVLDRVGKALLDDANAELRVPALLRRIRYQQLDKAWKAWANRRLQELRVAEPEKKRAAA